MDGIIGIAGVLAIMLLAGGLIAMFQRGGVSWRWLAAAMGLVLLNDVLLTNVYGLLPDLWPEADRNWQGKLLALAATLAAAALPALGWREAGLTLRQEPGGLKSVSVIAAAYAAVFLALASVFPNEQTTAENIAFQLTMPGFEEEPFYRGVLLLVLYRAFTGRKRLLGVDWSWGAVLSCILFGLVHAFGFSDGGFRFDPLYMLLTAGPSFLVVWMALRTRSVLIPILLHNFGNAIMLLV